MSNISEEEAPVRIDRMMIGSNIGRLMVYPDGKTRLFIKASAKTDGSIVFLKDDVIAMGFNNED